MNEAIGPRRASRQRGDARGVGGLVPIDGRAALDGIVHHGSIRVGLSSDLGDVCQADWLSAADGQPVRVGVSTLMGEMVGPCRVSPPDGAFLEMSLQNVAARERVLAQVAHVWSIASICASSVRDCMSE